MRDRPNPTKIRTGTEHILPMAFDALPPTVQFPVYDLRPRVEIIGEAPEPALVQKLREMTIQVESEVVPIRREAAIQFREAEAAVLRAEQDGWYVDVAPTLTALRRAKGLGETALKAVERNLAPAISRAITARVPGANTVKTYLMRIIAAPRALLNDLDDWEDSLVDIQKRMVARGKDTVMARSARAYEEAIEASFGVHPTYEIQLEPSIGGPYIRFDILVGQDKLADTKRILDIESVVHEKVALNDEELVGLVALNYITA